MACDRVFYVMGGRLLNAGAADAFPLAMNYSTPSQQ
mgnify:CR=1 FL=1